jgi:hypothetical protein
MEFDTEIKAGTPKVIGVNRTYSGLLDVEIPLDPSAPPGWVQIFDQCPSGLEVSLSTHPPMASASRVQIRPPDDQLEKYKAHVLERVRPPERRAESTGTRD